LTSQILLRYSQYIKNWRSTEIIGEFQL